MNSVNPVVNDRELCSQIPMRNPIVAFALVSLTALPVVAQSPVATWTAQHQSEIVD